MNSESTPSLQYRLQFDRDALAEWQMLDGSLRAVFKKLLAKRLVNPHIAGDTLHGPLKHCYKIKLRKQGYRLIYRVEDDRLIVIVIAIGRRDKSAVYDAALKRVAEKSRG